MMHREIADRIYTQSFGIHFRFDDTDVAYRIVTDHAERLERLIQCVAWAEKHDVDPDKVRHPEPTGPVVLKVAVPNHADKDHVQEVINFLTHDILDDLREAEDD